MAVEAHLRQGVVVSLDEGDNNDDAEDEEEDGFVRGCDERTRVLKALEEDILLLFLQSMEDV